MNLRLQILSELDRNQGYAMPEKTLFQAINLVLAASVSEKELREVLDWLKAKGYIDFTVDEMSEARRWKITEAGKGALKGE